ncbi:uncharacterized protein LOC111372714 [Olea europaea var. sylvestris]|uniref:uncharacterized protein LOC111372714 n=1 Tax=Olea europaea var. sylvestris TaxID=158386 RepID=UPI000C1CF750|nr:uncharacterized protein LOC111372714 [Olea europaea var. sylvestris]
MSPPLRRSRPATPEVQMPESSVDRDREGRPVSPPAPSPRASTIDLFELLMEMRGDMAELRDNVVTLRAEFGDMTQLRYDVGMLRSGLGDLHAEVAAIRGDIAGLRETSDYRDGGGSGGTCHYRDGGGDEGIGGYRDGGTGGYRDGGVGGYQGGGGQMRYVDSSWPSVATFDLFLNDTMGMEERERIPMVEGVPVQDILEDVEGVPEEERVPEMAVEVVLKMTSPDAEGIPEEVGVPVQGIPEDVEGASEVEVVVVPVQGIPKDAEGALEEDRVLEVEMVPMHGIPGDVEGAPEEERVPEVEVVPEKMPDSPDVVFVSEEVVPIAGEGSSRWLGRWRFPRRMRRGRWLLTWWSGWSARGQGCHHSMFFLPLPRRRRGEGSSTGRTRIYSGRWTTPSGKPLR